MDIKNYDRLVKQVFYAGFGDAHKEELKDILDRKLASSTIINLSTIDGQTAKSTLNFRKDKEKDTQYFNGFETAVYRGNDIVVPPQKVKLDHTFYTDESGNPLGKKPNITRKELEHLISGKSIRLDVKGKQTVEDKGEVKEIDVWRNVWMKFDLTKKDNKDQYHRVEFPDFQLEKQLDRLPQLKELENETYYQNSIQRIEKGYCEPFTVVQGNNEVKIYVEADPSNLDPIVYDQNMNRVTVPLIEAELENMSKSNNVASEVTQALAPDQNTTQGLSLDAAKSDQKQSEVLNQNVNSVIKAGKNVSDRKEENKATQNNSKSKSRNQHL